MIDSKKIDEVVRMITNRFIPDKIILFGSSVNQNQNTNSDLDLVIIQDTNLPVHKRSAEIRYHLIGTKIPIDILVYTNEEFEIEKNNRFSFLNLALQNSKVLYERNSRNN